MVDKIKRLAKEKGVPLYLVEKDCGLTSGAIYHWDKTSPSYERVLSVARYFDITVEELVNED